MVNGITLGSTYSLIALGYTLIFGVLNIVNMAHGEIFMFGAFIGLMIAVHAQVGLVGALLAAMAAGAALGYLMEVLALRPARVQVNWLAFPGTSGAPWIDYVLADAFVLPADLAPHFSERIVRLPRCFQPSDIRREPSPPPPRQ